MKIDLLFRKGSIWVGVHWSPAMRQWCVNLLPCVTLRIKLDPFPAVTVGSMAPGYIRAANNVVGCYECKQPIRRADSIKLGDDKYVCNKECLPANGVSSVVRCRWCKKTIRKTTAIPVEAEFFCSFACVGRHYDPNNNNYIEKVVEGYNKVGANVEHITFAYKDSGLPAYVTAGIKDTLEVHGEDVYLNGEQVINLRAVQIG